MGKKKEFVITDAHENGEKKRSDSKYRGYVWDNNRNEAVDKRQTDTVKTNRGDKR